jgi:hypothetical protein
MLARRSYFILTNSHVTRPIYKIHNLYKYLLLTLNMFCSVHLVSKAWKKNWISICTVYLVCLFLYCYMRKLSSHQCWKKDTLIWVYMYIYLNETGRIFSAKHSIICYRKVSLSFVIAKLIINQFNALVISVAFSLDFCGHKKESSSLFVQLSFWPDTRKRWQQKNMPPRPMKNRILCFPPNNILQYKHEMKIVKV